MCQKGNRHRDAFRFGNSLSLAFRFSTCVLCSCLIEVCVICIHTCVRCRVTQLILKLLTKKKAGERDFFLLWFFFFPFLGKREEQHRPLPFGFTFLHGAARDHLSPSLVISQTGNQNSTHMQTEEREREGGKTLLFSLPEGNHQHHPGSTAACPLLLFLLFLYFFCLFLVIYYVYYYYYSLHHSLLYLRRFSLGFFKTIF